MARLALLVLVLALPLAACGDRPAEAPPTAPATASATGPVYQCAMHPQIVRHEPGTCPICGMALQRVDAGGHATHEAAVPGRAGFTLSPERQQLIGVTRATVAVRPLVREIRTAATIANDPALYQTLIEYREAVRTRGAIRKSPLRETHDGAETLVAAALLKLHRLGIDERALAAIAGIDPTTLILPGPRAWVYAQLYEEDAPLVTPGTMMTVDVPSFPGRRLEAPVLAVDPLVNPISRTVRARALVATPAADLRPDTYVTATLRAPLGEVLAAPREAVLDSGTRRIVFVVADDRFTPREVALGRLAEGYYEVLGGLEAGEQVVTSANFLIDSESRFQAAVAAFGAGGSASGHQH